MHEQDPIADGCADPAPEEPPTDVDPAVAEEVVHVGSCPICGVEFDDSARFRDHLADVHELVDDEGKETRLIAPLVSLPIPLADPPPSFDDDREVRAIPKGPPDRRRPIGLVILVLLLLGVAGGFFVLVPPNDHDAAAPEEAAVPLTTPSPATDAAGPAGSAASAPTGSADVPTSTVAASGSGAAAAPAGSSSPAPTTTKAPAPPSTTGTTTPQLPAFAPPTTAGAQIDGCTRDHNRTTVTFSWQFVGGAGWSPLPAYTSLGGGRYRHVVTVPAGKVSAITTVQVLDASGTAHGVALQPALSTASC